MKIDLEGLDIAGLVQASFSATFRESLRSQLPKIVEKMLTESTGYGKEASNMVRRVFRNAVEMEIEQCMAQFMAERRTEIHDLVRAEMEKSLAADTIAEHVTTALEQIKVTVKPFGAKTKKIVSDFEEEDD